MGNCFKNKYKRQFSKIEKNIEQTLESNEYKIMKIYMT